MAVTERELLAALAELARISAGRPDRASFASSLVLQVLRPFDACCAAVGIIDAQGYLDVRTMFGFPAGVLRDGPRYPINERFPLTDAVRRGTVVEAPVEELVEEYPGLDSRELRGTHMICQPLLFRGATIGATAIATNEKPDYAEHEVFWRAIADLVSANIAGEQFVGGRERTKRSDPLSPRQLTILRYMQQGHTNSQIARSMNFGTSTIGHDIMGIFDVFGAESRREAVAAAEREGILAPLVPPPTGESEEAAPPAPAR
jgi:DNA-binding CsgD family transcriptional regulator